MLRVLVLTVMSVGCGRIGFAPGATVDATDSGDGPGAFGAPTPVTALNSGDTDVDVTVRGDALELYFVSKRVGGADDIFRSARATVSDAWSTPTRVVELSTSWLDITPSLSFDGLSMWLSSNRPSGGSLDVFLSTRTDVAAAWSDPVVVPELCTTVTDDGVAVTADGLALVMYRLPAHELYASTRPDLVTPWAAPTLISELNTPEDEVSPAITADGLTLVFAAVRAPATDYDLYIASRPDLTSPFGAAEPLDGVNSSFDEFGPWLSPDGRTLWFGSDRAGTYDLYEAAR